MNTSAGAPRPYGPLGCLYGHAARTPEREAAVDEGLRLSYSELASGVRRVSDALAGKDLGAGHVVAYIGPPGVQYLVSLLAAFELGSTWLGLNPKYRAGELSYVIGNARPAVVLVAANADEFTRHELAGAVDSQGAAPTLVYLEPGLQGMTSRITAASISLHCLGQVQEELLHCKAAVLVYTSGSTGRPKGACLTLENLMENAWWLARRIDDYGGRIMINLPINHVGCIADTTMVALVLGCTMIFVQQFDPVRVAGLVKTESITTIGQIPTQFQMMWSAGVLTSEYLSSVRHLAWGGAAMPHDLIRELQAIVPDLFNSYGLTESTGTVTITRPGSSIEQLSSTVGLPVVDGSIRLVSSEGDVIEPGMSDVEGEVQVLGAHVFAGYLNNPEATKSAFAEHGWLRTGDVACWCNDGSLRLVGRRTEMYKSGGYNIFPGEIESVLESHPAVEMACVIGVPDPLWGESGSAYVKASLGQVNSEELAAWCKERLAAYKVPKHFAIGEDLPMLPVGKIDRGRLKALHAQK